MHHSKHWLSSFALEGLEQVTQALQSVAHFPVVRISDSHLEHGRFSLLLLSRALKEFRLQNTTPIELFRLDFPGLNYSEMMRISNEEPESYLKLPNCFTYFTPGPYMTRMHPDQSIHLHIASHILTGVNVNILANDTFYPSNSTDALVKNTRKQDAVAFLTKWLTYRESELVRGGKIYFDVMGRFAEGNNFSKFLDKVLFKAIHLQILPEKFRNFGFRTHCWEKEDILSAVDELKGGLEIVSYKEVEVVMPEYQDFLLDQDKDKYASGFTIFWKNALAFALKFHFKTEFTDAQYKEMIGKLLELIQSEFLIDSPICKTLSHHLLLQKP